MAKKIALTLTPDYDTVLALFKEGGAEVELAITDAVVANIIDKALKPLLKTETAQQALDLMRAAAQQEIAAQIGTYERAGYRGNAHVTLAPELQAELERQIANVREAYRYDVEQIIKTQWPEFHAKIEAAIKAEVERRYSYNFEAAVATEVNRRMLAITAQFRGQGVLPLTPSPAQNGVGGTDTPPSPLPALSVAPTPLPEEV